ncbi:MAG: hypothetical protein Q9184_005439 [Pyrenodesmia sp. 2 TL-2023]
MAPPEVFRWVLDVQPEWPCQDAFRSGRDAAPRWAQEPETKHALMLLPVHEQEKVLRFYHIRDAKLSLGSQLLKHCAIVRACKVRWPESIVSKDVNHKPCYIPAGGTNRQMEFNVSHHGSIVALVGSADNDIRLGVDVVQVDPSKDIPRVRQEGWSSWVDTYEAVFSNQEVQDIVSWEPSQHFSEEDTIKARLRHFYAHWCLKEAYVKMTGEALMATWLKDMEFRNVQVPEPTIGLPSTEGNPWGKSWPDVEVWLRGSKMADVKMELQAFRDDYMVGTAVSSLKASLLPYEIVDLQRDVYSVAEAD